MQSFLYRMTGRIVKFYPEKEIQINDSIIKIRDFDLLTERYDSLKNDIINIVVHFTIKRKKNVRELDKIDIGDTVDISFTIQGYHWSGKDGIDGKFDDWVYNNLLVRSIRKIEYTQSEFGDDIDEWRRQQREEQENNEQ